MFNIKLAILENGDLLFKSLAPAFFEVLQELPSILQKAEADERCAKRLFQDAYDREEENAEWRRHAAPELAHLFRSGLEILEKDISQMEREPRKPHHWRLKIPSSHHTAWMSSLNAARLALGELHCIQDGDMERERAFDPASERDAAILKIHLLGWLEEMLVDAAGY